MSLQGRQLGRYRILEPLGSGGMSVVYRGHDTALGRDVAVKVLHPHLAGKPESRQRLAREAQAVARLRHPNILEIYDFSTETAEEAYLVTEYIRGQTLREFLESETLDPPEVAALVVHAVAGALASAHGAGVIHRDLKPDNVMLREDGVLKLMDFGIAKVLDREERMTMTGALMGSPAHMAPEVIEGEPVSPAADVFSLGTMLYLFVTGRLPFLGPNATATLKRILDGRYEDPRQLVPSLSRELAEVIAHALARRPEERYPDAGALRDALADCLARVGLERPEEELATFFAAPSVARSVLGQRLVANLLERAERAAAGAQIHEAIDLLNQAQALEPGSERALALLASLQLTERKHRRRQRVLRVGAAGLAGLGALGALGFGAVHWQARALAPAVEPTVGVPVAEAKPSGLRASPPGLPSAAALAGGAVARGTPPVPPPSTEPSTLAPGVESPPAREVATAAAVESPPVASTPGEPASRASAGGSSAPVAGTVERTAPAAEAPGPRRAGSAARRAPPASTAEVGAVEILIRPWAHVSVDGGPFSVTGLQTLKLALRPGTHRVRLRCPFCEDTEEVIEVKPGREAQVFALSPTLKPARLSFEVTPDGARVEIDGDQRLASATLRDPYLLRTPKGERPSAHEVRYTVSLPGYRERRGVLRLNVGEDHVERAALERP